MQGCAGVACVEQGMFDACSLSTSQDKIVVEVPTVHLFVLILRLTIALRTCTQALCLQRSVFHQIEQHSALESVVYFAKSVSITAQPAEATCQGEQPRLQSPLQCYWHQSHCRSMDSALLVHNAASVLG
jgi:hypothetical protein